MNHRVVVTGMSGICPIGDGWDAVRDALQNGHSGVTTSPEYDAYQGLSTRLIAPVPNFKKPKHYPRRKVRSMGRVSLLAAYATEHALTQAGLLDDPLLGSGRLGIAYGSTSGSPPAMETYARQVGVLQTLDGITAAKYVQLMSHTCAANLAQFLEIKGRIIPSCSACTSGSQSIGYAYEAVKWGLQDVMIAGGAEELHVICTAVFDIMRATSTRNDAPHQAPRPFDIHRDGLVVGEGAATLVLESLEHAQARGATILAELIGFATCGDGSHMVHPNVDDMARVQEEALADAGLSPDAIDYICAHATATEVGDIAESKATHRVFGDRAVPVSSLKGHMGHTLGACGALEAWICINAMNEGWLPPTLNLDQPDERCAPLHYLREPQTQTIDRFMTNNFAFGGVNSSLIFQRFTD